MVLFFPEPLPTLPVLITLVVLLLLELWPVALLVCDCEPECPTEATEALLPEEDALFVVPVPVCKAPRCEVELVLPKELSVLEVLECDCEPECPAEATEALLPDEDTLFVVPVRICEVPICKDELVLLEELLVLEVL